jgi:hypothetical protein
LSPLPVWPVKKNKIRYISYFNGLNRLNGQTGPTYIKKEFRLMKALYFEEHGELDVIQYGDVPEPETGSGQIKIRVRATALNYLDIWMRRGWPGLKLEMPHWCGADIAGEIVELGEGVYRLAGGPAGCRLSGC